MTFDPKDSAVESIVKRLRDDEVGWLVTVHDGTPRPVPVWFLWDGDRSLLIYSAPRALDEDRGGTSAVLVPLQ